MIETQLFDVVLEIDPASGIKGDRRGLPRFNAIEAYVGDGKAVKFIFAEVFQ